MSLILEEFSDMLNENMACITTTIDSKLENHSKYYEERFFKKSIKFDDYWRSDTVGETVAELSIQLDNDCNDANRVSILDNRVESDSALESKI